MGGADPGSGTMALQHRQLQVAGGEGHDRAPATASSAGVDPPGVEMTDLREIAWIHPGERRDSDVRQRVPQAARGGSLARSRHREQDVVVDIQFSRPIMNTDSNLNLAARYERGAPIPGCWGNQDSRIGGFSCLQVRWMGNQPGWSEQNKKIEKEEET